MASKLQTGVRTMDESFHELLDADTNADKVTSAMRRDSPIEPGPTLVPVARYVSREFHELEKERLWSRVWQLAAHEDDFPNVGDVVPYDIVDKSYLVVRTGEEEYRAYYNACLHRGRKLRESRAKGLDELRCPFHGWCWNLDGTIKQIPCAYDFTGLKRDEQSLPEVRVGRWGRFIFINPDPDCAPLEDHLGDLGEQFTILPYEHRYKRAHVAKVIKANWKVVQEAFMESYHVLMTHPQSLTGGVHDSCTKYDVFGNYSRAIRCGALDGEGVPNWDPLPQDDNISRMRHPLNGWVYEKVADGVVEVTTPDGRRGRFTTYGSWLEGELTDANPHLCIWVGLGQLSPDAIEAARRMYPQATGAKQESNMSPRALRASQQREALREILPSIADSIPDIELSSSIYLTVFPNWHPWGSFNPINYRFRPNGDNHEECIAECMMLAPIPEDGDYTPVSEIHWLGEDEDFTKAPELGTLAKTFNQDTRNMPYVHEGLKATAMKDVQLADYNETKIRHFHKLYGQWVG